MYVKVKAHLYMYINIHSLEYISEIKHAFSCLLQYNLHCGEILFEIKKPTRQPWLLYFKQHFDTKEVILQQPREQVLYFYSSKATK